MRSLSPEWVVSSWPELVLFWFVFNPKAGAVWTAISLSCGNGGSSTFALGSPAARRAASVPRCRDGVGWHGREGQFSLR